MKLKVCGITTLEQLQELQRLNIDYAGLIFYPSSKRYAGIKLKHAKEEIQNLEIKKVGVFVNEDMEVLKKLVQEYSLSAVQLHGDESPSFCVEIRNEVVVIKVFRIGGAVKNIDALLEPYQGACDYFMFDTDTAGYGGSGKRFDWTILKNAAIRKPFFLSGGIGPDDMAVLKSFKHSFFYAVDINSRFETTPGIKDMEKIKSFSNALKQNAWIK